jgi:hypothetical protein
MRLSTVQRYEFDPELCVFSARHVAGERVSVTVLHSQNWPVCDAQLITHAHQSEVWPSVGAVHTWTRASFRCARRKPQKLAVRAARYRCRRGCVGAASSVCCSIKGGTVVTNKPAARNSSYSLGFRIHAEVDRGLVMLGHSHFSLGSTCS